VNAEDYGGPPPGHPEYVMDHTDLIDNKIMMVGLGCFKKIIRKMVMMIILIIRCRVKKK
jgi:hypothetical protein